MHIAEGILPLAWAAATTALAVPIVLRGARTIQKQAAEEPATRPLLGLIGAAVFVISALPIPVPITGTAAHPTGVGLAAILIRPGPAVAVTAIVLLLQALFMAHGGLTTWGANVLSMGVLGSWAGYLAYRAAGALRLPFWVGAGAAGVAGDLLTYAGTATIMALALHGERSVTEVGLAIFAAFLPTQIPLAALEGVVTVGVLRFIGRRRPDLLRRQKIGPVSLRGASHAS